MTSEDSFDELYTERFGPTWEFARTEEGILTVFYKEGALAALLESGAASPPVRFSAASLPTSESLWVQIAEDEKNRIVILTGHGGVFADAWESQRPRGFYSAEMWSKALYSVPRSLNAFLDTPTLLIGAINGPAMVHAEYLLLCDVVVAAESAVLGDRPHYASGHVPGDGVNIVWPLLLGWNRGREFLLRGRTLTAHQALDLGLVSEVVADEDLIPRCRELARELLREHQLTMRFTAMALRQPLKTMINQFVPHTLAIEGMGFIDQSQRVPE